MQAYPDLDRAWQEMLKANALYQPTEFWREASRAIMEEIKAEGIDRFRRLKLPLDYFVPTYGAPGNSLTTAQIARMAEHLKGEFPDAPKAVTAITRFMEGEASAYSDYRVFQAGDRPEQAPNLQAFSESSFGQPAEHFNFDGRSFSRSSLNYILGLTLLKRHLNGEVPRTVLEIGGGFGSLGEILASSGIEGLRYIDIDIPPMSFVAESYLRAAVGDKVGTFASTGDREEIEISSLPTVSALCSWQIERLRGNVDLFVNFISFQEMEPNVVKNYLSHVMRLNAKWVLLRNMREGKQIKKNDEVGVLEPILGDHYLQMLAGYSLVERNVVPFGFRTVDNFHSELLILRRGS
jgi:putative sugar O-methyltransferase